LIKCPARADRSQSWESTTRSTTHPAISGGTSTGTGEELPLKQGKFSYGEFGRKAAFKLTSDLRITYIGHATKAS